MPTVSSSYELIKNKIDALKSAYPSLRAKTDDYVFDDKQIYLIAG